MTAGPARRPAPHRGWVRAALVLFAAAGLGGVAYLVAAEPPTQASYYPKCTLYQYTHLHCPGCGTGRAAHFALNGRLLTAAGYNPFAIVLLPIVAFAVARSAVRWVRGRPTRSVRPIWSGWILALAIALTVYGIARNLPWYPFTLLAPAEL